MFATEFLPLSSCWFVVELFISKGLLVNLLLIFLAYWNVLKRTCKHHLYIKPLLFLTHSFRMHYSLIASENFTVFWCFLGVEKGCIGNEWVNKTTLKESQTTAGLLQLLNFLICWIWWKKSYFFSFNCNNWKKISFFENKMLELEFLVFLSLYYKYCLS